MLKQFAEVLLSQLKLIDEVLDKIYIVIHVSLLKQLISGKDYISILTKCLTKTKMCGGGGGRSMSSPKFTFLSTGDIVIFKERNEVNISMEYANEKYPLIVLTIMNFQAMLPPVQAFKFLDIVSKTIR